jgi:hypothetical protein
VREAKALVPSACAWRGGGVNHGQSFYPRTMGRAVPSRDPFQTIRGGWLIRRLSPDSNPIEITDLPKERDERTLLHAMGMEAANVHLGSDRRGKDKLLTCIAESHLAPSRRQGLGQSHGTSLEGVSRSRRMRAVWRRGSGISGSQLRLDHARIVVRS